jgi:hypothetical protein
MTERLPWSPAMATGALILVFGAWAVGVALLALANPLGWLVVFLAAWLTLGLVYTAMSQGDGGEPA